MLDVEMYDNSIVDVPELDVMQKQELAHCYFESVGCGKTSEAVPN